jgi:carbonic anhydrase
MKKLLPGLRRFSETIYPEQKKLFRELASGQTPHTLFITCSDSRIDPTLVTQTQPGELFVVRNAGNIIPPYGASKGGEEAAIEYAVEVLGVKSIVVCGHSMCGAMKALGATREELEPLPSVRLWLRHADATRRLVKVRGDEGLEDAIEQNTLVQIQNLKTHPVVWAAIREKRVHLFAWVYHFERGHVCIYDKSKNAFVPSAECDEEAINHLEDFEL